MGMTFTAQDIANGSKGIPISGPIGTTATTTNQYLGDGNVNLAGGVLGDATVASSGAGSYPASTSTPLNTAAIANTQKSIDQLPAILQAALDAEQMKYENANRGFNEQQAQEQAKYDTGTTTNQQNYDSNLMAALRSGAKGLGGLLSILRGTGIEDWARGAVADTTNSDIRTGLDTRDQNQTSLDTSLGSTLTELAGKRRANDETLRNNQFAARGNNATQLQDLYGKMAGFYSDAGNNGEATRYMNMAGDQSPEIARYSIAPVSAYDSTPVNVKAANVTAFGSPTQQNVTSSNTNNGSSAGIFTVGDARKRLAGVGA